MKVICILCGVLGLWSVGMLWLVLNAIPELNQHAVLAIAGLGAVCIVILLLNSLYRNP